MPCYSLVYLELAACRLTALPDAFAGLFPNVRVLNLNYNFLADPEAAKLRGLVRLRRLSMVGGRVGDAKVSDACSVVWVLDWVLGHMMGRAYNEDQLRKESLEGDSRGEIGLALELMLRRWAEEVLRSLPLCTPSKMGILSG